MSARALLDAAHELSQALAKLEFPTPVAHVYDPHRYAWAPYEGYVTRYGAGRKQVVLLGMTHEKMGHPDQATALYERAFNMATGSNPPNVFSRRFTREKLGR